MLFSPELLDALVKQRGMALDAAMLTLSAYEQTYQAIPGAPAPGVLTAADVHAVAVATHFKPDVHRDWAGLQTYVAAEAQADQDRINPYLPSWFSKTDDRPNIWVSDTTNIPDDAKTALATAIKAAMPQQSGSAGIRDMLSWIPTDDGDYMSDLVRAMWAHSSYFAWDLGEGDDPTFRWGPCLCLLAGLGAPAVRSFALCLRNEDAWQNWAEAEDSAIAADAIEAHKTCGYPLGLLRCDYTKVQAVIRDLTLLSTTGLNVTPRWVKALMVLHILKYVRRYEGSVPKLFVAYDGAHALLEIPALTEPLNSGRNAELAKLLCKILRIPYPTPRNREWLMDVVTEVFRKITPASLPVARSANYYPELLLGPGAEIRDHFTRRSEYHFCRPGIAVHGAARLCLSSGKLDRDYAAEGPAVFQIQWPLESGKSQDKADWKASLPEMVQPVRFSETVGRYIRNWNRLGHDDAAKALVDTVVTMDLYAPALDGTPLGAAKTVEYPLVFALPMGANKDDTTNQGKTTLVKLIADALVPGIRKNDIVPSSSTSAPAIRSIAEPLYRFGTAIYDEFIMPDSRDHVLCQSSLQALATGSVVTPGRVQENDPGVGLKHPLFFSAKLVKNVTDIQNRMVPLFMDTLSDATRCSEEEFEALSSGGLSVAGRLNHLLWCYQNNVLDKLREMRAKPHSTWRFGAHLACSSLFIAKEHLAEYFTAAATQMASQFEKAEESGLTDNMNITMGFDIGFFLSNVHEMTMKSLLAEGKDKKHDVLDVLINIVEDGGRRRFSASLAGTKENTAKGRFTDYMKRKNWTMELHDIEMTYVPINMSKFPSARHPKAYITFRDPKATA